MKVGFFDTGSGGATILKEALKAVNAEYIYLADNQNAPYGLKDKDTVKRLTEECIKKLIDLGCKIIVIACNTATSASIKYLRDKYKDITFIGTEPAIKPAIKDSKNKKIILSATSLTLKGDKLFDLIDKLDGKDKFTFIPLDKLVGYADFADKIEYDLATTYINNELSKLNLSDYSGIVLGCTHFPIFKEQFKSILPENIKIYDSSIGVVDNLKTKIDDKVANNNVELILTKEDKSFRNKFIDFIK